MSPRAPTRFAAVVLAHALAFAPAAGPLAAATGSGARTVTGHGVRFAVPSGADRGRFTRNAEGQWVYRVITHVRGLGALAVIVEARGDPESTLVNELIGVEANARSRHMKRSRAHSIDLNRSRGGEALETVPGGHVAHAHCWSATRQYELTLEAKGDTDPLDHPVWKRLLASFRSDEPPLK